MPDHYNPNIIKSDNTRVASNRRLTKDELMMNRAKAKDMNYISPVWKALSESNDAANPLDRSLAKGNIVSADPIYDALELGATAGLATLARKGGKTLLSKVGKKSTLPRIDIPDIKPHPLDFSRKSASQSASINNAKIQNLGDDYFKELSKPASQTRLKNFGEEYDIDLEDAFAKSKDRWTEGRINTIGGAHDRFKVAGTNIFKGDSKNAMGISTSDPLLSYIQKKDPSALGQKIPDTSVNYINKKADPEDYRNIVWHELSHDINKKVIKESPKLQKDLDDIFVISPLDTDLKSTMKARDQGRGLYKSKINKKPTYGPNTEMQEWEIAGSEFDYITNPTETWAFLSTNLRQDLKKSGLIKDYNQTLTPELLKKAKEAGNTSYSRFSPYIKDEGKFIDLFNKMTLATAPVVGAAFANESNNKRKLKVIQ